ncbi:PREDICTED: uncharacterized protein LOC108758856 [Trachymyrmex cornetzi]|uniref:Uncharacterized protein n=1 Tax=Trachymyrmex cornetzi TaxID=471704 RepID=A0A195ED10_9HYME|nr:PREDICTED: uncharacterized protein LOC108758856 [Trachymyrmex cornetzi]XP_018359534.1 PREDICTED: uncharacterized protein LOC108758856 [Trachymyrmex cornetzi]KYN22729.1 hypothetical protein ALC57_04508 [Trachymyrmex cornetzi]
METLSKLLRVLILSISWTMTSYAAPLLNTKDIWSQNVFAPVIKAPCSSDGQCWEWLPILETYNGNVILKEDSDISRLQSRRHVASPVSEFMLRSWKDNTLEEPGREIRASLSTNKQMPIKITKKDVFVSRNWGAGGMPFSVLYMNPRSNHAVATSTTQQESGATTESLTPFVEHPNSRVGSRNGQSTTQPRKQYWTIPQLFISYGWGSFGK